MQKDYTPYSEEWKKEISKLPKNAIIEMAAKIGEDKEKYRQALKDCRQAMLDYGMDEKSIQIISIDNFLNENI